MTYEDLENDKSKCMFRTHTATIGSRWIRVIDNVEREIIYLGKITGKPIFGFPENIDVKKSVNHVMIIRGWGIYRYRN